MDVSLPAALADAVAGLSAGRTGLATEARRLSEGYRREQNSADLVLSDTDAVAYALSRMPATYAASLSALTALATARPDFRPDRLLDLGAGPGTAAWAATAVWPDVAAITLVERNRRFLDLSAQLAAAAGGALAQAERLERDLATTGPFTDPPADLAVLSYALTELSADVARRLVVGLIEAGTRHVVIIEPGTPRDHDRLLDWRRHAIAAGARPVAPCPHAAPCPLATGDWCHFSVRLPRSRQHLRLKGAVVPFEDEPYAYLVLEGVGAPIVASPARVLRRPQASKHDMNFRLCRADGQLAEVRIERREAARWRAVRKLGWGDDFPDAIG